MKSLRQSALQLKRPPRTGGEASWFPPHVNSSNCKPHLVQLPAIVQAGIIYLVTLHLLAQGWSSHDRAHFSTRPQAAWQGAVRPGDTEQSRSSFLFLESKNRSSSSLFVQKAISSSLSRARATSQAIAITLITPPNCRTIRTPRRRPASRRICTGPSCSPCQTRGSRALTRSTVRQRTFSRLR